MAQPGPPAYKPQSHTQTSSGGSSNKGWYIATAVVAVLVIATVSILIATSGDSGGGGTASGCEDRTADDKGFSECMRELAGAVAENNECSAGASDALGGAGVETQGATVASCTMDDGFIVMYTHFGASENADGSELSGVDTAKKYMDTAKQQFENLGSDAEPEEGDWEGDGLSGTYYSIEAGYGVGIVLFQVNDSPVAGMLMHTPDTSGSSDSGVLDFFDQHVKPGSDGGA
jgi:hypothetical protein